MTMEAIVATRKTKERRISVMVLGQADFRLYPGRLLVSTLDFRRQVIKAVGSLGFDTRLVLSLRFLLSV
jgi:hypothetical protein